MSGQSPCRSCKALVQWVKTTNGRSMPIDPYPVDDGNIELISGVAHVIGQSETEDRYRSHFASCPGADKHRKKR